MAEPDPPAPEDDETPDIGPETEAVEAVAGAEGATDAGPEPEPEAVEEAPLALDRVTPPVKRGGFWRGVRRLAAAIVLVAVVGPIVGVLVYRFVPPPITILMVQRLTQGQGLDHRWKPMRQIAPALPRAVIAAEDARFCSHHGFDFIAMQKAFANNGKGGRVRGGSTISQQTAKNIFLWPSRTYIRKGFEAYDTLLIELIWGKRRIMEVYLNSVEWGPGVYGAEAAAQKYFKIPAAKLSQSQASRLAAILPSPLKWKAVAPGPYVRKRSGRINAASGTVRRDGLDDCIG
jgi:monofunctional glycosyltransferase